MSSFQTLVLGGGCFWCTEAVFDAVRGVMDVESGYANGHVPEPSYEAVCSGETGHAEVVKVVFDPAEIDLAAVLDIFFATHDPTTLNRQGHDVGTQYRSAIYWTDPQQEAPVRAYVEQLQASGAFTTPIVTELQALKSYWPAEDYHQDFFARHPYHGYCMAVAAPKVDKLRRAFANRLK